MPKERKYILDTNILINFSLWVPISLNRFFWEKLGKALKEEKWILLDVVINEIKYEEELLDWCKRQKKNGFVKKISDNHRGRAIEINNTYKMIDETTGNSTIDTYIIAYAEANDLSIFTRESIQIKENGLFKIPEVCKKLNILTIRRPMKFLENIGFKN